MSALFSFTSWVTVCLLTICASAFLHAKFGPYKLGEPQTKGFYGLFWKAARIGERMSPWVALMCCEFWPFTLFDFPTEKKELTGGDCVYNSFDGISCAVS